jgi:hypothetical protein
MLARKERSTVDRIEMVGCVAEVAVDIYLALFSEN